MRRLLVVALGVGGVIGSPAWAQKPSETEVPSCLDNSIKDELGESVRPRGVQKKKFLKDQRVEIVARAGLFAADLLSSSYIYGGAVTYWFTEDLGFEASFDITPIALDIDSPLAEFFQDDRFEDPGTGYLALGSLVWAPMYAKLKMGDGIAHANIMLALGAGKLFHDTVQGVTFDAGAIVELYINKGFTVRIDVRDVIAVQEAVTETRLTNNIVATAGVAVWVPFW